MTKQDPTTEAPVESPAGDVNDLPTAPEVGIEPAEPTVADEAPVSEAPAEEPQPEPAPAPEAPPATIPTKRYTEKVTTGQGEARVGGPAPFSLYALPGGEITTEMPVGVAVRTVANEGAALSAEAAAYLNEQD